MVIERLERWLYLMAKPPPRALSEVMSQSRKDGRRPDLAHVTLLRFADLECSSAGFLACLLEAMRGFRHDAFHIGFNRIVESRCVTLRSRRLQREARDFQEDLLRFLEARGLSEAPHAPQIHLTINYRRDGMGGEAIRPFDWCVDEVVVIESISGQSRHVVHGRWPLDRLLL